MKNIRLAKYKDLLLLYLGLKEFLFVFQVEREIEEEQKENGVRLKTLSKLSSIFRAQRQKEDEALADQRGLNRESVSHSCSAVKLWIVIGRKVLQLWL